MKTFDILVESTIQDLNVNKFFEKAVKDLPDVTVERIKHSTPDKRLFDIKHRGNVVAYVIKKKHFVKPKFIMRPQDKNLKIKPVIIPYIKGMKIKFKRMTTIVNDFTNFIDKCCK